MRTGFMRNAMILLLLAVSVTVWVSCRPGRRHDGGDIKNHIKSQAIQKPGEAASAAAGIREVDFKNFTYVVEGSAFEFKNGEWAGTETDTAQAAVKSVSFGALMNNGREQAVVVLSGNWGGGNLLSGHVQVFDFHDAQSWEVISLPGEKAEIKNNALLVSYPEWDAEDPICCPTLAITETYRWNGLTFNKERSETRAAQN